MAASRRRLLVPAVLLAGSACTPQPEAPKCGSEAFHACWPDGGFACPPDCGGLKEPDGGLKLSPSGDPTCLC